MHRLNINHDDRSFDERSDRLLRDVRRQIDEDLQNFGFGRSKLLAGKSPRRIAGFSGDDDDDDHPAARLLSHDFFKLRPTPGTPTSPLAGVAPRDRVASSPSGSRETLDEDTTKRLYVPDQGQGRLFCMSFDVKDYEAEDISVTVEEDTLTVQAKHKMEKDGAVSTKEFSRKIKLPKDVDPEKLVSTMTSDGILTIEAQVPPEYLSGPSTPCSPPPAGMLSNGASAAASTIPLDTPVFSGDRSTPGSRRRMDLVIVIGSPYTPEDISVKLEGRRLIVEATHEEKYQGKTSKVSMHRDFDLQEDIDVSTVQALHKGNGQLTITAFVQ